MEPISGVAPELAIVRRRVIIAMIVVLGLAALAGIALARVLGGRMRRLASTTATLSRAATWPPAPRTSGSRPRSCRCCSRSINGMAGRLESLVGEITSERDRDRAMIGSLAEGVLTVAPDGTVTVANDAPGRYLGLPEDAGSARLDALPTPIIDAVLAARAADAPAASTSQVTLADGVELELTVSRLGEGPHAGTVVTLRDVTAQRRLERARRDLVANVSHELKTPIAALKGFLELLEGDRVSERHRREFLAAMSQETARLERLVEEQLQLARLDAGALPLEREELDLGAAGVGGRRAARPAGRPRGRRADRPARPRRAGRRGRRPGADRADPADPARQRPAPHAAAAGGSRSPSAATTDEASVAVRDTGEGIPPESQPFVFDRFYRGDVSREGRSAGLGLAIARGIAAAHGGSIGLRSVVRPRAARSRCACRCGPPPAGAGPAGAGPVARGPG